MARKSKFSVETKLEAIEKAKSGLESQYEVALMYGVNHQTIRNWVRLYETYGVDGLAGSGKQEQYSEKFKRDAVAAYKTNRFSQEELCKLFHIRAVRTLQVWISEYNEDDGTPSTFEKKATESLCKSSDVQRRKEVMPQKTPITQQLRLDVVAFCIENKNDYNKAAEKYGVSYSQVYNWVRKYLAAGADGLIDRRGRSKNPEEMTEIEKLRMENRLLKAENQRQAIEIEALKKVEALERGWG
jgi:transposase-like protein